MNKTINQEKEEILYLNRELNRKNNLIKQLQQRISNLIDEKNILINEISLLKNENSIIKIKSEENFKENKIIYDKKEKELLLIINKLRNSLNKKENDKNNLNEYLRTKLIKANEEINNLKIMNNNRDNILLLIHHFFQNIKNNLNLNYELHLDFIPYIFYKSSFVNNLKVLESEIINKISNKKNDTIAKDKKVINKNRLNKQKIIFMNRFKKKEKNKININIQIKKGNKYFRTPKRFKVSNITKNNDNNNTYIEDISSCLLSTNNEFLNSRLNNTIE